MNQEQKQEALERLQRSQEILEAGLSRIEEIRQLYSDEFNTRKNDEEHQRATLMPYTSKEQINNLTTEIESLKQWIETLDRSEPLRDAVNGQVAAMDNVVHNLNWIREQERHEYNLRRMNVEARIRDVNRKLEDGKGGRDRAVEKREALSESEDES